jgi:glycosyltransferase involved in cell wall biosynthesis
MMRVLWVSHSLRVGGSELALVEGVQALAARGHRVEVVVPGDGPLQSLLADSAPVHVIPHNPWVTHSTSAKTAARWMAYNVVSAAPHLARLARSVEADVIISNTLTTMAAGLGARFARVPHAWFIHEFGDLDHGARFILGRRATFAAMQRMARLCLVNSDAVLRYFSARLPGAALWHVPYAVAVPDIRRTRPENDDRFRLLVLGNKTASKGQLDAVLALGILARAGRNVELWLIGPGEAKYEQALRQAARDHDVASLITFADFDPDPFAQVCNADTVLMCSRAEAFGRVTVEAMKAGKPVIGAATGATPELVRHGCNGFLYQQGDAQSLAHWADILYSDRATGQAMGRRGQQWATATFNAAEYGSRLEAALLAVRATATSPRAAPNSPPPSR